jgi:hypothetical protein
MSDETCVPEHVPLDRPSPARIYDYLLGGYHNFAVDRVIADRMLDVCPEMRPRAQANRAFLRRAVRFLAENGIEQCTDAFELPERQRLRHLFEKASPTRSRSPSEIARFFGGFALVEPGLVYTPLWRPEGPDDFFHDQPARAFTLAGVARKP